MFQGRLTPLLVYPNSLRGKKLPYFSEVSKRVRFKFYMKIRSTKKSRKVNFGLLTPPIWWSRIGFTG